MVRYLGEYIREEIHERPVASTAIPKSITPDMSDEEVRRTYNIILEFGECDLDEYFAEYLPPVTQTEVEKFWEGLFEVADAVKGVHSLQTNTDGRVQEYYG